MDNVRVLFVCCIAAELLFCCVSPQKIPPLKQGYSMKAGVERSGLTKNQGEEKNASENASSVVERVKIKIADPPTLSRVPAPHSPTTKPLVLRAQPANVAYPSHLFSLAGECFSTTEKGYKYVVCPFFNVTQKELSGGWNKFEGVLGVWREWIIENDTIVGMQFVMGEKCGSTDREAVVYFNCSTTTSVHTVKEPSTCKYSMWMDTPLACFKGAMQVYHLLSEEQLKRWDGLDEGYYAGELTEQGLKAKRRVILIEANLLYSQEQSEQATPAPKEPQKKHSFAQPTHVSPVPAEKKESGSLLNSRLPFTNCIEQNMAIRKELREVKAQLEELLTLIGEFPSVAARYATLKNSSRLSQAAPSEESPVTSQYGDTDKGRSLEQQEKADEQQNDESKQQSHQLEKEHSIDDEDEPDQVDESLSDTNSEKLTESDERKGDDDLRVGQGNPTPSEEGRQEVPGNTPDDSDEAAKQVEDGALRGEGKEGQAPGPGSNDDLKAGDSEGATEPDHTEAAKNVVGFETRSGDSRGTVLHVHGRTGKPSGAMEDERGRGQVTAGVSNGSVTPESEVASFRASRTSEPHVTVQRKAGGAVGVGKGSHEMPSPDRKTARESL